MKLIGGEKNILESKNGELILTTHRVRLDTKSLGTRKITSILLQELSSCELAYRSYPILLLIMAIGLVIAGVGGSTDAMEGGIAVAVIALGAYFLTRRQALCFASAGASMLVETKGMNPDYVKNFIDEAEIAKNLRALTP